jgi:hypothetical protein
MTTKSHEDYTVGWICPLEIEQTAALEMPDEEHKRLLKPPTDHNIHSLRSIGGHNVVIAGLYQPGNNPAATVVTQMRMTFSNLRFGLLVGVGGGVPVIIFTRTRASWARPRRCTSALCKDERRHWV